MNNAWDEINNVLRQAHDIDMAASDHAARMARLLNRNGNLRRLPAYQLREMKRELRNFDMTTGKWKP